jgi:hypothetical protein
VAAEAGIPDDLPATERDRRLRAAVRVRMTRAAMARWGKKKAEVPDHGTRASTA